LRLVGSFTGDAGTIGLVHDGGAEEFETALFAGDEFTRKEPGGEGVGAARRRDKLAL
jgi:hypothetical protein